MKKAIKNIFSSLYRNAILFNNPYYFYGVPKAEYQRKGDRIELKKFGFTVTEEEGESLIRGYPYARKIQDVLGGKFTMQEGHLFLEIGPLRFHINSAEEFFIIYEVFITEDYKYSCVRDTVFVDIGMNSGITTLYYAQQPLVKQIYSYELFGPTYVLGQQNLKLNGGLAEKVKAFNYGVSNKSYDAELDYSLSRKGRMGLKGLPGDEQFGDTRKEKVQVRDIAEIFEGIISQSENKDIVVKMDCEGEEYNLIDRLSGSGLLSKLTVLMIEWHYTPPTVMEEQLKAAGFHVFSQTLPSMDSGMLHAARRSAN